MNEQKVYIVYDHSDEGCDSMFCTPPVAAIYAEENLAKYHAEKWGTYYTTVAINTQLPDYL